MVKTETYIFLHEQIIINEIGHRFIKFKCPSRQNLLDWREISESEIENSLMFAWQELLIATSIRPKLTPELFNDLFISEFQRIQKLFYDLEWLTMYDITEKEFGQWVSFLAFINHWQESEIRLMPVQNIIYYQERAAKLYEQSIPKY